MKVNSFQDRENVTPCQAMDKHRQSIGPSIDQALIKHDQALAKFAAKYWTKYCAKY